VELRTKRETMLEKESNNNATNKNTTISRHQEENLPGCHDKSKLITSKKVFEQQQSSDNNNNKLHRNNQPEPKKTRGAIHCSCGSYCSCGCRGGARSKQGDKQHSAKKMKDTTARWN
jgi:hypothetical protein